MRMRLLLGAAMSLCLAAGPAAAQQRDYFVSGAANVQASKGLYNPYTLLARKDVQAIADEALKGPISAARLTTLLRDSEVKLDHLLESAVLVRLPDGRYRLDMTVFTAEDRLLLDQVSDPLGRSLAASILDRREEFDRILGRYDMPGVDPSLVRMALIGCLMLDWDGLRVTADNGFRTAAVRKPNGDQFQMVLRERTAQAANRALYYGSHNMDAAGGAMRMSTFGDHHPGSARVAFPDLTWIVEERDFARLARAPVTAQLADAFSAEMTDSQDVAALVMRRLREGPADAAALSDAASQGAERTKAVLDLLAALQYVEKDGDRYRAIVPVFTLERDGEMIGQLRDLGRAIMLDWFRKNYDDVRRRLAGLTALKAGVPFKTMFTEIWHPIFGWTNYHLVREGYLHDPYGPKARFVSFVPFVWDKRLRLDVFS